jgi:hypothetical protein
MFGLHAGAAPSADLKDSLGDIPAGFDMAVQRRLSFSGSMHEGLRVSLCEPFVYVYTATSLNVPGALRGTTSYDGVTSGAQYPYALALNPYRMPTYESIGTSSSWAVGMTTAVASFLQQLLSCFGRYQVLSKLKLHYKPLVPTTDTANFVLAVTADGAHPVVGVSGNAGADFPVVSELDNGMNSVSFASWMPWSVEFPVDNTSKYTYQIPAYSTSTTSLTYPESDTRSCSFGSIACLWGNSGASYGNRGLLFWEYDIDLLDPFPINAETFPLTRILCRERLLEAKLPAPPRLKVDEPDDEPDLVSVRSSVPAPPPSSSRKPSAPAAASR